jgi:recombinational DNA repair protein (RecF pathway)
MLDVVASGLAPSPYHRCVNCRSLKKLKDLRTPSFWRGGKLCRKCWRELNIGHHQRQFKKAQEQEKKKPARKATVRLPARRKRRKARKK